MVNENLIIEKLELLKERTMANLKYRRFKPEHLCLIFDELIKYINDIKT